MKSTLRDKYLKNITISEKTLTDLNSKLEVIVAQVNKNEADTNKKVLLSYIVRFDEKGCSLFEFQEALNCYQDAKRIERFIFAIDCVQNYHDKMFGKSTDINLDVSDQRNCRIVVQGDDSNWVDNTYSTLIDVLDKAKNYNCIIRTPLTPFLIQVGGIIIGVLLSITGAQWLEPKLNIEYALPFAFIIVFLLFSNIWMYLYTALLGCINRLWPNVTFKEKQNSLMIVFRWVMNIILGAIFLAGVKSAASFVLNMCGGLFK